MPRNDHGGACPCCGKPLPATLDITEPGELCMLIRLDYPPSDNRRAFLRRELETQLLPRIRRFIDTYQPKAN